MQPDQPGAGPRPLRRLIAPAAVIALAVATIAAVIVTQDLRREGTVFSATTVTALDRPDGVLPGRKLRICFRLNRDDRVDVELTDPSGERVRRLATDDMLEGDSRHCYRWNGRDEAGRRLPAGRYRLRLTLERAERTAVAGERAVLAEIPAATEEGGASSAAGGDGG